MVSNLIIDKEIKRRQRISIFVSIIIQLLSLISPFIMGKIVDDYLPEGNAGKIIGGIVLFVLIPMISISLQTLYNYYTIKFIRKKGHEVSLRVMENLIYQDASFYDRENSLEILSYAGGEALDYIQFYISDLGSYYVNFAIGIVIFFILCRINIFLGLLQLLYIPLAKLPVDKISEEVSKEIGAVITKNAQMSQIKGDIFQGIETIKTYTLEDTKIKEVKAKNEEINGIWGKVAALDTLSSIWMNSFVNVLLLGVTFGVGALFILRGIGSLKIGQLISTITYCGLLYNCISIIFSTDITKAKKESEYEKLFEYLTLKGEREVVEDEKFVALNKGISLKNVSFTYEGKDDLVLKGLNMEIEAGKFVGIVGSSGGGKSTILDLILKLYPIARNMISIDDIDLKDIDRFSLRKHISKVSQDVFLFPGTIEDNLRLINPEVSEEDINKALSFACLEEYIAALPQGIKTDIGEAGKRMSGGEKQRLAIAQAILRGSKVLLLDEITSDLDVATEQKIASNFRRLVDQGYTILAVSHRYQFLKDADVIYQIKDGQATIKQYNELAIGN